VKAERRFLIAPSLVRLILKERFIAKTVVEGYFAPTPSRTHFVRVEPGAGSNIVLQTFGGPDSPVEERTKISPSQAEALLDVCAGQIAYRRTHVRIAPGFDAFLDRLEQPGALDLLAVEFDDPAGAAAFDPPGWFGPEVTGDLSYRRVALAVEGLPGAMTIEVDNAAVIALVDTLEGHAGQRQAMNGEAGHEARPAAPIHHEMRAENGRPVIPFAERAQASSHRAPAGRIPDARIDEVLAGLSEALESTGAVAAEDGGDEAEVKHTGTRGRH
jgi:CYTH domain-containing protein